MFRAFTIVLAGLTLIHVNGCNQPNSGGSADASSPETTNQLRAFGRAFEAFHLSNGRGPNDWEEAVTMGPSMSALREKGCLVAWGIRYRDATVGASKFVLAYPPSTMESGGPVLMLDGKVRQAKPEPLKLLLEEQAEIGVPR